MFRIRSAFVLSLGGNLPLGEHSPTATAIAAVAALASAGVVIRRVSRFYATPCFPVGAGPDFVNAALLAEAALEPGAILTLLHRVEAEFGRSREQRWAGRTLDIDLLACGDRILPDRDTQEMWRRLPPGRQATEAPATLILPHPRLQDRAFALVPMRDVAPSWVHPLLNLTVAAMCDALPPGQIAGIRPV